VDSWGAGDPQMNEIINNSLIGLNKVGGVFYAYAASVFIQSALLVILLFVIDLLLRKRVRAVFRYCVWLLVLVKLILPPMLSLPTGIGYWAGDHLPTSNMAFDAVALEHARPSGEMPLVRPSENIAGDDSAIAPADSALTALTWQAVVFLMWLAGVLAFLAVLVQRIRFVRELVTASCPAGNDLTSLLEQCRRQTAVRRDIKLRLSEAVPSPAVCGLVRPTILMPSSLIEKLSPEGLRATLVHELAHITRGDLWVNSVQTFLQVVYFYNPFVWFANSIIRKVCEEAVDETVLVVLGGQAKNYSNTLIDIGETVFWKADLGLRLIGVAESKKALQWRIKHMLNRPIPKSSKLGVVGIAVLFVIAAVLLPMAKAEKSDQNSRTAPAASEAKPANSLHEASARGEIERVKALITDGAPINAKDEQGQTPLHRAAKLGRRAVVEYLLAQGADTNEAAPLHRAVAYGQKDVVEVLLNNGANVNAFDKGWTPLHYAAFYGYTELVALLIDNGADVNARMKSEQWKGWSALHMAGRFGGSIDVVEHLIDNGAEINSKDDKGNTPLHTATRWARRSEVVELLLNKGADVNARNNMGQTPLHVGPLRDIPLDVKKVQILMARGADVSAKDQNGRTPLHHAAGNGFVEIVQMMITAGADVNAKTNDGIVPIDEALRIPGTIQPRLGVRCRQLDVADLLLANGADFSSVHVAAYAGNLGRVKELVERNISVNVKHASNLMPLHTAASGGHKEVVAFLIAKGADVKAEGSGGRTPLHYAAIAGHSEVAELLIAHGAEVNAVKKEGDRTILHDAVFYSHTDVAKVILDNGADVNKRGDTNGRAPLHSAMDGGSIEMVKLLIDRGADVNPDAQYGATPLHRAVAYGHKKIAELLIAEGADVNARGRRLGNTPLDSAVRFNKKELAELLLAKGADINLPDNEGVTPLWRAKQNNYAEIVELLRKYGANE